MKSRGGFLCSGWSQNRRPDAILRLFQLFRETVELFTKLAQFTREDGYVAFELSYAFTEFGIVIRSVSRNSHFL